MKYSGSYLIISNNELNKILHKCLLGVRRNILACSTSLDGGVFCLLLSLVGPAPFCRCHIIFVWVLPVEVFTEVTTSCTWLKVILMIVRMASGDHQPISVASTS